MRLLFHFLPLVALISLTGCDGAEGSSEHLTALVYSDLSQPSASKFKASPANFSGIKNYNLEFDIVMLKFWYICPPLRKTLERNYVSFVSLFYDNFESLNLRVYLIHCLKGFAFSYRRGLIICRFLVKSQSMVTVIYGSMAFQMVKYYWWLLQFTCITWEFWFIKPD